MEFVGGGGCLLKSVEIPDPKIPPLLACLSVACLKFLHGQKLVPTMSRQCMIIQEKNIPCEKVYSLRKSSFISRQWELEMKWKRQFCMLTNFVSFPKDPRASCLIWNYRFLSDHLPDYRCHGEWRGKWASAKEQSNEPRIAHRPHSSADQKRRLWRENSQSVDLAQSVPKARYSQGHNSASLKRDWRLHFKR